MKTKFKAAVGSLLISAAVAGAAVVPASGQAAEPGQVCNVDVGWPSVEVWASVSGGGALYYLGTGDGFRIVSYGPSPMYYYGHGNGKANGYLGRLYINQSSCHW